MENKDMVHFLALIKAFAAAALAALLNYLIPIQEFLTVTLGLVVADLVAGIFAARKRKEAITSSGLRRSATKFTMYAVAIVAAHAVQQVYFAGFPMVFTIAAYIGVTEFWSLLENVGFTTGANILAVVGETLQKFKPDAKKPPL